MNKDLQPSIHLLYEQVRAILFEARKRAYRAVHFHMVSAYWETGRLIVTEEQEGKTRAEYGKYLLKELAEKLTSDFGKNLDERELRKFRQFYMLFPIRDALRPELSWTHYRRLLRVKDEAARHWYMNEAATEQWGTRSLDRQINALYYERLSLSIDKAGVKDEADQFISALPDDAPEFVKDPFVLEFLNLRPNPKL